MTTLLVYYSRTGATRKVATEIAPALNCQIEEITDIKSRKGIIGYLMSGKEAVLKKLPAIGELKHNPADYDLVIIGTPNWGNNMASPLRAYLSQTKGKIKKFALIITQGGSGAEKARKNIEDLIGLPAGASMVLSTKEVITGSSSEKINLFIKQIKYLNF